MVYLVNDKKNIMYHHDYLKSCFANFKRRLYTRKSVVCKYTMEAGGKRGFPCDLLTRLPASLLFPVAYTTV